jgi:hypothetical protein
MTEISKEENDEDVMRDELESPKLVDRRTFQAELDALRLREKAHTREGDAIAAAIVRSTLLEGACSASPVESTMDRMEKWCTEVEERLNR